MGIQALPPLAIRTLTSSQVITGPESVIKELLDNSIDAQATSVFVELSGNTLDIIQVRDNGHGVPIEDRPMLCRRHCTSKIKDLSDLKVIGPRSLGFRGDALASISELSSALTITTRVEGEQIALKMSVGRNGEITGQSKASHPIGTTVRVQDLLSCLPVRRQVMLKSAIPHIQAVRRLMQAYALARPAVRLSLRIYQAQNERANWTYAPNPTAAIDDAAFRIVGTECAASCQWKSLETQGYKLSAFLPRPDALPNAISGLGCFVSIDSRPVSTRKGLLKQVNLLFRDRLRLSTPAMHNVKAPFWWLSILCPSESYDANIEPSKDDILFADCHFVLAATRQLLDLVYTPSQLSHASGSTISSEISPRSENQDHEQSSYQWPIGQRVLHQQSASTTETEHEHEHGPLRSFEDGASDDDVSHPRVSNPRIIAKMTASTRYRAQQKSVNDRSMAFPLTLQELGGTGPYHKTGPTTMSPQDSRHKTIAESSPITNVAHSMQSQGGCVQLDKSPRRSDSQRSDQSWRARWTRSKTTSGTSASHEAPFSTLDRSTTRGKHQSNMSQEPGTRVDVEPGSQPPGKRQRRTPTPKATSDEDRLVLSRFASSSNLQESRKEADLSLDRGERDFGRVSGRSHMAQDAQAIKARSTMRKVHNLWKQPFQTNEFRRGRVQVEDSFLNFTPTAPMHESQPYHRPILLNLVDAAPGPDDCTSRLLFARFSLLEVGRTLPSQYVQHIIHTLPHSREGQYRFAPQVQSLYAQSHLHSPAASFTMLPLTLAGFESTSYPESSTFREPALTTTEVDEWACRLGRFLQHHDMPGGLVLEENHIKGQILKSLSSTSTSA